MKLKQLQTLQIGHNPLNGTFPRSFPNGNLSMSHMTFLAAGSGIRGQIPIEIGNLTKLIWLGIDDNYLTGMVPRTLGNLQQMQRINLGGNRLDGTIPANICNLKDLYFLALDNNKLSGRIPSCLGNLSSLTQLYLDSNQFFSSLPPSLWLNNKIQILDLSSNHLSGAISPDIGLLSSITELYLSSNQFTGEIPSTLRQLQHLVNLSLSINMLHGHIPQSFGSLVGLEYLDLSQNNLSGVIPMSLEKLQYLVYLNVSFNHLIGKIPNGGPFRNFSTQSFMGNDALCGLQLGSCESPEYGESRKVRSLLKYVLPTLALILLLAIFVIVALRSRSRNTKFQDGTSLEPPHFMRKRISYHDMLRATDNFDESNLIGSGSYGSVYMAKFADGAIAAVKVFNLDSRCAFKSFDSECKAMRDIRHRNLVKVIGICSNQDVKALVLEYMSNGSMERWLHNFNYCLDFVKRLEIMLDVASTLEYLHHNYFHPIVHCDLKPSNVLLDEDMVAHLGDFGIAKILTLQNQAEQTDTLGTIGYMAPGKSYNLFLQTFMYVQSLFCWIYAKISEYEAAGIVSAMGDVYSYGILLAETFTRKKPTDEMFS
ncbi:receptor kinase-like protein Xa21 isoform X1 [Ipomoea triloba]|uniref:receptor kinase-like protein Xa21 isoform X1 n=1 Tax=Ipomoea triloba TaxID=35885 RepID=UPI00125DC99B|nr:receptor kinase-like protein Xa21 isoform X1 [Ipomoea triloba]